jgi:hypothetical protein
VGGAQVIVALPWSVRSTVKELGAFRLALEPGTEIRPRGLAPTALNAWTDTVYPAPDVRELKVNDRAEADRVVDQLPVLLLRLTTYLVTGA